MGKLEARASTAGRGSEASSRSCSGGQRQLAAKLRGCEVAAILARRNSVESVGETPSALRPATSPRLSGQPCACMFDSMKSHIFGSTESCRVHSASRDDRQGERERRLVGAVGRGDSREHAEHHAKQGRPPARACINTGAIFITAGIF